MENSQGLLLLPRVLFNLVLERAIRDSRVETTGSIFYKSTQILAYADDIDIIGLRLSYVAEAYQGTHATIEQENVWRSVKFRVVCMDAVPMSLGWKLPSPGFALSSRFPVLSVLLPYEFQLVACSFLLLLRVVFSSTVVSGCKYQSFYGWIAVT